MQIVDLSHVMNVHTPGWVGYAGNKMYYAQNLQTQMIVAQRAKPGSSEPEEWLCPMQAAQQQPRTSIPHYGSGAVRTLNRDFFIR